MKAKYYLLICLSIALLGCAREKPVITPEVQPVVIAKAPVIAPPKAAVAPERLIPYPYLIKPGDWLSAIAQAEYGAIEKWHHIYAWNRLKIGDNPDLLYPWVEIQLRKPEVQVQYEDQWFVIHRVLPGDCLWAIAETWYEDGRAWRLIFHDNRGMFPYGIPGLRPGTPLRIRPGFRTYK